MNTKKSSGFENIEKTLGYAFKSLELLKESLMHKSYAYEKNAITTRNNERLEFLGDAVLDMVVSDLLMEKFPKAQEGELSKLRASVVNEEQLARLAQKLNLGKSIYLGKGEELTHGRTKSSILSSTYEAVVAAIYLDGGYDAAYKIISEHFNSFFEGMKQGKINDAFFTDFKSKLQEEIQKRYKKAPHYIVTQESGPDHHKLFQVQVSVTSNDTPLAFGSGKSKKEAEQDAARSALKLLAEEESF